MKVVLLEQIRKLGKVGEIVDIKGGFARNYLLPNKKALRATVANIKYFESARQKYENKHLEMLNDANDIASKLDGKTLKLVRKAGETGQLYGSVTSKDITQCIQDDLGIKVDHKSVIMSRPLKITGKHEISVEMASEVFAKITVNIVSNALQDSENFENNDKEEVKSENKDKEEVKSENKEMMDNIDTNKKQQG